MGLNARNVLTEGGEGLLLGFGNQVVIRPWLRPDALQSIRIPYDAKAVGHRLPLTTDQWGTYARLAREGRIVERIPKLLSRLEDYTFTTVTPLGGMTLDRFLVAVPSQTLDSQNPYEVLYALIVPKSRPKTQPDFLNRTLFTSARIGSVAAAFPQGDASGYALGLRRGTTPAGGQTLSFLSWRYEGTKLRKTRSNEPGDPYRLFAYRSLALQKVAPFVGGLRFDPIPGRVIEHFSNIPLRVGSPGRTVLYDVATGEETLLPLPDGFARLGPFFLGGELLATA